LPFFGTATYTGVAIIYALDDCLEKYGFRDSSNVTDKDAKVMCGIKPYKILMAVSSQYLSDFESLCQLYRPVDFVVEKARS
jgi:hypothetical protein